MGKMQRSKGARVEREIVNAHKKIGIHAERVPMSGASEYTHDADIDIYPWGPNAAPLVCEVKARKDGEGFKTLESWLDENDVLFLKRNRLDPLVLVPWRVWERLLK